MYLHTVLRSMPSCRAMAVGLSPCRCSSMIMTSSPSRTTESPPPAREAASANASRDPRRASPAKNPETKRSGEFSRPTFGENSSASDTAHRQGPDRGAAVRAPPRSVQRAVGGFHGHRPRSVSPAPAGRHWARGLFERSPARPDADDPGRGDRRRRAGRSARRCGPAIPPMSASSAGDRPAARALRHRPGLRRRRSRHDLGQPTIAALEERGLEYVLGARERTDSLVRDVVLEDARPSRRFVSNAPAARRPSCSSRR